MGGAASFKRDDKTEGQGLQVLVDAKAMKLKSRQLDRIWHEFHKIAGEDYYTIDLESLLAYLEIPYTVWCDLLFQMFDRDKKGQINFYNYMVYMWHFLATGEPNEDNLAALCFQMFDVKKTGTLEVFEVKFLIHLIHNFKIPMFVGWAIDKLDKNEDGFCTVAEFILLCRHYTSVLTPLIQMRATIRTKVVFTRFWKEIGRVRTATYGNLNIFDILDRADHEELKLANIMHINAREDVPVEFADRWKDAQDRRNQMEEKSKELFRDLPPETLTDEQLGIRSFFANSKKSKKKEDKGNFAHLHSNYNDDTAMGEDSDRAQMLVEALKDEHARKQHSKRKSKKKKDKLKHSSVKAPPGTPQAAPKLELTASVL